MPIAWVARMLIQWVLIHGASNATTIRQIHSLTPEMVYSSQFAIDFGCGLVVQFQKEKIFMQAVLESGILIQC